MDLIPRSSGVGRSVKYICTVKSEAISVLHHSTNPLYDRPLRSTLVASFNAAVVLAIGSSIRAIRVEGAVLLHTNRTVAYLQTYLIHFLVVLLHRSITIFIYPMHPGSGACFPPDCNRGTYLPTRSERRVGACIVEIDVAMSEGG